MYTRKWVVIFWDIRVTKYKFGETQHNEALKGVVLRETQGKDLKEEEIKWEPNCEEGPQRVNSFAGHERIYENERLRRGNEENKACWYTLEF